MSGIVWYSNISLVVLATFQFQTPPEYPFIGNDSSEKGIYHYTTTNTAEAVYILDGHVTGRIVADFRNYQWSGTLLM